MKEAAGEANLTVIAIDLIGIVAAVATPLISNMMETTRRKSCCTQAGGNWSAGDCIAPTGTISGQYFDQETYDECVDAE